MTLLTKIARTISGLFIIVTVQAQTSHSEFTLPLLGAQVLSYQPKQRAGVTDQKFNYAKRILDETRAAARQDSAQLNVADYWNIVSAFVALQEPKATIELAFNKAVSLDASRVCTYIKSIGTNKLDQYIPETFLAFYQQCLQAPSDESVATMTTPVAGLDVSLATLLARIHQQDSRFRTSHPIDWARQRPLDSQNQKLIDSLYQVHHTYIGRALVGKPLSHVMWAVIQHSSLPIMERYLPVLHQAVQQRQLEVAPFKMLLDRVYTLRYGSQLFGSQVGVPLADESLRAEALKSYSLN